MTNEQFEAESHYQAAISIVKSMLKNDLITPQEYNKINTIMLKKYQPILGGL